MQPELIFYLPPLRPDGQRDLQAQVRQGDMQAIIILRPYYTPGVYQWETYWDRVNTKIRRKLTPGQDERGLALAHVLKERLIQALGAAGWQDAGQNYEGRSLWRYVEPPASAQRPVQSPTEALPQRPKRRRKKASTRAPMPVASQVVTQTRAHGLAAYQRTIQMKPVTFTCAQCGQTVTRLRYPGRVCYCSEECRQKVKRTQTRARVQRLRARQKAAGTR